MRNKIGALVLVILLVGGVVGAFAAGSGLAIGAEAALYPGASGLPFGAMLMIGVPTVPLMFGIGLSSAPAFGLTVDYWGAHGDFTRIFSWYLGVGGYLTVGVGGSQHVTAGGRIPLGLQLWPVNRVFEVFLEAAPAAGVNFTPTGIDWHVQAALGIRFWL